MKENSLIRLIQTFVLSRIVYVAPFLDLKTEEKKRINVMIRKTYKQALGIPVSTSNERFEALGLHNTIEELIEAHRTAQMERLSKSQTGRHILESLRINYEPRTDIKTEIPADIRRHLYIPPLPKHMHPSHNEERRKERAKALGRRFENSKDVLYVDAADYEHQDAMAVAVVNNQGHAIASATILTTTPEVGEEVAIALAMTSSPKYKIIISDSKTAILNYAKGRISPKAQKILQAGFHGDRARGIQIIWAPAHSGLPGNVNAHDAARGFADRDDVTNTNTDAFAIRRSGRDRLVSFREIIDHYRLARARYPAAHCSLNKWQSVAWRLIQTNTFPNPIAFSHYHPDVYTDICKHCNNRADLQHIIWACPKKQYNNNCSKPQQPSLIIRNEEQWETVLLSSDPDVQARVVQMAEDAAAAQGLPAAV